MRSSGGTRIMPHGTTQSKKSRSSAAGCRPRCQAEVLGGGRGEHRVHDIIVGESLNRGDIETLSSLIVDFHVNCAVVGLKSRKTIGRQEVSLPPENRRPLDHEIPDSAARGFDENAHDLAKTLGILSAHVETLQGPGRVLHAAGIEVSQILSIASRCHLVSLGDRGSKRPANRSAPYCSGTGSTVLFPRRTSKEQQDEAGQERDEPRAEVHVVPRRVARPDA